MIRPVLACSLLLGGALLLAASATPASAQRLTNITGQQLIERCAAKDRQAAEQCLSYIGGVADTAEFYKRLRPEDGSKGAPLPGYVCVPTAATGGQLRDAVAKWVKENPAQANRQASGAVMDALYHAYPCKKD